MVAHWSIRSLAGLILGLFLGLNLSSMAQAGVIYEQALNTIDNFGFPSNTGSTQAADNFSLVDQTRLESIKWYGSYQGLAPGPIDAGTLDTFEISIFESLGSTAAFSLSSSSVTRSELTPGQTDFYQMTIYEYEVLLSGGWDLAAGDYLLSISNSNTAFFDWFWSDSSAGADGVVYYRDFSTDPWDVDIFNNPDELDAAFVLSGEHIAVPEPTTPLLLLAGVLALLFSRRETPGFIALR